MRAVIAEDELLFRMGLVRLLTEGGIESSAKRPMRRISCARSAPTPPTSWSRTCGCPGQRGRRTACGDGRPATVSGHGRLVLSHYVAARPALELIGDSAAGVGYLLKDRVSDLDHFVAAVRRVASGGSALDPEVVSRLLGRRPDPLQELTARERQVLALMAEGRSNRGIADVLVVTEDAVEKHVRSILRKLSLPPATGDHRRVLAVLSFLRGEAEPTYR